MKITDLIVSIPPHISTSWENIASLHMQDGALIFTLKDGKIVSIHDLLPDVVEQVFSAHASFLEAHLTNSPTKESSIKEKSNLNTFISNQNISNLEQLFASPLRLNANSLESMGQVMQHNPAYSGLPPIPDEVVNKIATLAKVIPEEDLLAMPLPEVNCNCMYCQINRILRAATGIGENVGEDKIPDHPHLPEGEEKISEEDLKFEQWKVAQVRDNMYIVSNKLDNREEYTVYLGNPVGCTCGKSNCEHIVAVLRS